MTEKLFYQDAYCREFEAVVTDCVQLKTGYGIVLDRTAFYPEGGGQPGDRGQLFLKQGEKDAASQDKAAITITDTHEKNGEILHCADVPAAVGSHVRGQIDWAYRFELMQNHSGEHMVSGLIHDAFGYENVGFHMGSECLTIDLNGELTMEQLRDIELAANQAVWQNLETQILAYTEKEVAEYTYRSKKELHGLIRIVTFPGVDSCACCGLHVARTGEIGLIKIISCQKFKGGVRIEMLCGMRAYQYINRIWQENHQISVLLSAKELETAAAVKRLHENDLEKSYKLVEWENRRCDELAAQLEGSGNVLLLAGDMKPDLVRRQADALTKTCDGICAVFAGTDEGGYKYAVGMKDGNLTALTKELNQELHGRGGGKPFFVQGSIQAGETAIRAFFQTRMKDIVLRDVR